MKDKSNLNQGLIYTDDNCIGCNKCIRGCPVIGANIADTYNGHAVIHVDGDKCIHCGRCLHNCEHGARYYCDDLDAFLLDLKAGEDVVVFLAPSFFINYEADACHILGYLKSLGVKEFQHVGTGADIATWAYIKYLRKSGIRGCITSPCPVVVDYIEKYKPSLISKLLPVMSPLQCMATHVRKYEGSRAKFAFLGPCIGKKTEAARDDFECGIDYNITFATFMDHIRETAVDLNQYYEDFIPDSNPGLGAYYPIPGGLKNNIRLFMGHNQYIKQVEGTARIYDYLDMYENLVREDRALPYLVDILNCSGGCTGGPASEAHYEENEDLLVNLYNTREYNPATYEGSPFDSAVTSEERWNRLDDYFEKADIKYEDFVREYHTDVAVDELKISEETLEEVFLSMGKLTRESRCINCSSCGYNNCTEMATAIVRGYNTKENCIHYMKDVLLHDKQMLGRMVNQINGDNEFVGDFSVWNTEMIAQALQNAINTIEKAKENADNANQAKSLFLASMSHEIRTPLNAIIGMTDILMHAALPSEYVERIHDINVVGTGLLDIVNDLLDLSKIEAGHFSIEPIRYSFTELMDEISNVILFRAREKHLMYRLEIQPSVPAQLIGDDRRIRQILINLLGNAVKFTEKGSVMLRVNWNHDRKQPVLIFDVEDTGIGIKAENINSLFDSYSRVENTETRTIEGTGLGLAISKNLALQMNGDISVKSIYGAGSTFTVILEQQIKEYVPIGTEHAPGIERNDAAGKADLVIYMPRVRILVVDDLSVNLQVAEGALRNYQLYMDTALGGKEALNLLAKNEYDMVFMDYLMPGMNGVETLSRIRLMGGACEKVPVICLTAEDSRLGSGTERFQKQGFQGYLCKPMDQERLGRILMQFIPKDKIKKFDDSVTVEPEQLTACVDKEDYEKYLELVCAVERMSLAQGNFRLAQAAKIHRQAVQSENYEFVQKNAEYLAAQIKSNVNE